MENTFPQSLEGQLGKCVRFTKIMKEEFQELRLVQGYVSSPDNVDNNPYVKHNKQYTHVWLVDSSNTIIDPTVIQYTLLGELHYQEFEGEYKGNCMECGVIKYSYSPTCKDLECIRNFSQEQY